MPGFAHLFEHLMFNGSKNFDDGYFQALVRVGTTDMNGTTNEDRTNYFQNVPISSLDVALWMESDRMGHLNGTISQEKLDEQRFVVQNEKRQGENQPYAIAYEMIQHNTYTVSHPNKIDWVVVGDKEKVEGGLKQLGMEIKLIDTDGNVIEEDIKTPVNPETSINN